MAVGDDCRLGYNSLVGLAPEETFGSHQTATVFIEFNSEALVRNRTEQKIEAISTSRNFKKRVTLEDTVEGSVEFDMNIGSDFTNWVFQNALGGTVSTAILTPASFSHTFNEGNMENNKFSATSGTNTTSLSFSVRKGGTVNAGGTITGDLYQYNGMRVNALNIKAEAGGLVVVSAEMMGQSATQSADSITAAYTTFAPQDFTMVTVSLGDSIGNVSAEAFQSFELTINNNLVGDTAARQLGSRTVSKLPPTRREVTLNLTQRWDTTTTYDRYNENTATAIQIFIDTGQTITASTGATTYSMQINIPKAYLNAPGVPEVADMGILSLDEEWAAIEDSEQGYAVRFQTWNATNDYN